MLQTFHGRLFQVSGNRNFERGNWKRNERNATEIRGKMTRERGGIKFLSKQSKIVKWKENNLRDNMSNSSPACYTPSLDMHESLNAREFYRRIKIISHGSDGNVNEPRGSQKV